MEVTKFNSHLFGALGQAALHLLNQLTERAKNAVEKMRGILAGSVDTAVVANAKIAKFSSQFLGVLKQAPAYLRQALEPLTESGRYVLGKARHLQDARRARESVLRELLSNSVDAVVVTNLDRRFVAANLIALDLFGVSETNITQFTIDAFLLEDEFLRHDANGLPFISPEETQGACKIRRLTGHLRIADYIFVLNFVPFRHLFIFRSIRECPQKTSCRRGISALTGRVTYT